jgi:N,N-dimethylformamidase
LYYVHLEGKTGAFFSFPWVVAPAQPGAPIAVLASTNTWNAYNNFGGRSNYINPNGLPPVPAVNVRLENVRYRAREMQEFYSTADGACPPLSFERPEPFNHVPLETRVTDPIRGRNESHLAPTEWRLLGWLEREGHAYDLYADYQLHDGTLNLAAYKVLILNTNHEYWSGEMYTRVKAWVTERGGKLMYLGGDGIDGPIEFLDEATVRHHNSFENVDVSGANREGTKEIRFDVLFESPARLLGVVLTTEGIMSGAPFRVLDETHWAFAGTGLKNGALFGEKSLHERAHGGASGHETDKISRSSPKNLEHLAKGINPDNGGADMVFYETTSGGAVFSAGSITYPACLLVDVHLSRITNNVIQKFLS